MEFDINPNELSLQGPDGMQLVQILRKLIASIDEDGGDTPAPVENSGVFYCTYGTTTGTQIANAIANGLLPVCIYGNKYYYLISKEYNIYTFFSFDKTSLVVGRLRCNGSNWGYNSAYLQEVLEFDYTPTQGSYNPVTSGGVWTAIQNSITTPEQIQAAVDQWMNEHSSSIGGLSFAAKQALMACFDNVAWANDNGETYYNALYVALFGTTPVVPTLDSITATFTQGQNVIYPDASLDSLKQYLTVTANYTDQSSEIVTNYTLSGTLFVGTSVITVTYQTETTTFNVTVTARPTLTSITAVFTQGSAVIYDTDSLDVLKQYLVVTALYSDQTSTVVNDYTLSGQLTVGTSVITVTYQTETTTFNVTVSQGAQQALYPFPNYTGERFFITNGNHVLADYTDGGGQLSSTVIMAPIGGSQVFKTSAAIDGSIGIVNNRPTIFTFPANSNVEFVINVTQFAGASKWAANFKKANSTASMNYGTGDQTTATRIVVQHSPTSAENVGAMFIYFANVSNTRFKFECEVSLTVDGVRYI